MASAATLTSMETRVRQVLMDPLGTTWDKAAVDEGLRRALEEYSTRRPLHAVQALTLASNGREVALSTLTGLLRLTRVWFPYDASEPEYPPAWCEFDVFDNGGEQLLFLQSDDEPAEGQAVRLFYQKLHTLNGLDGATATTFAANDEGLLALGAAGYCGLMRSVDLNETSANMSVSTPNYGALASIYLGEFRDLLTAALRPAGVIARPDWSQV